MATYVPGTLESDTKKIVMSLQQAHGNTATNSAKLAKFVLITDYGGVGDGVTNNDAAFTAAWAALGTYGGCIYFPPGKYLFNSAISETFPASQFSVMLAGAGANCTTLYWPNASGGIEFIASQERNTFHLRDFTVETNQANGGNGFKATGLSAGLTGFFWQSDITNVDFLGSDIGIGTGTKYWSTAIHIHCWCYVTLTNVNTWGPHGNPGDAGGGIGLLIEGDVSGNYTVIINVQSSSFNSHVYGVYLGDYWQGVTFNQCNFNGRVGTSAIYSPTVFAGAQVLLSIFNSQFDYAGVATLNLGGSLTHVLLKGNLITAYGTGGVAVAMGTGGKLQAIGNSFGQFGVATGTFGIVYGGTDGVISDNIFTGLQTPVNLQVGSSNVGLSNNRYSSTGANIDNGTSNDLDDSAWSSYTPTLTPGSGTFTSASATGKYKKIGKTVFLDITITITTNGTAAGSIVATLPSTNASMATMVGREVAVSGIPVFGTIGQGAGNTNPGTVIIMTATNTYAGANGYVLIVSGVYEST